MDMAWDSAAYEAARASQIARGHDLERYHDDACSHVKAWRKSDAYRERPFRFEDLNGACEPAKWGPVYPKSASASVEKWRSIARGRRLEEDEAAEYGRAVGAWIRGLNRPKRAPDTLSTRSNSASGQAGEFDAEKHRAKIRAEHSAQASRDRLAWCTGEGIREAYKAAMRAKREREAQLLEWREAA